MKATRWWLLSCAIALVVVASACGSESRRNPVASSGERSPAVEADLRLRVGETVAIDDPSATVSFDSLYDSRCPHGVVCGVAGIASVGLTVRAGDQSAPIVLTLMGDEGGDGPWSPSVEALGHSFTLRRLDPYPVYLEPVPDGDRVLTLIVR